MEWAFFAVAVASLVTTLNAVRPVPWTLVSLLSFFGGWLATELAIHRLVIQVVILVVFPLLGGLKGWPGYTAAALLGASIIGTLYLVAIARGAGEVAERALKEGLGEDYLDHTDPDLASRHDPNIPWARLLLPFRSLGEHEQQMHADPYVNFRRMKTTNPIRASASVKSMPRNIVVRTMPAASGWRAIAVMALPTTMPMPMPGPMAAAP